jgi:hypothetical protein
LLFLLENMWYADSEGMPAVAPLYDISTIFHFADTPQPAPRTLAVGLIVHLTLSAAGSARTPMLVEILYFDGCPSYERLLPTVQRLAERAGAEVQLRRVESPEEAERERFLGSPTVRVDRRDIDPSASKGTDYGLQCRVYRPPGRGPSPIPPEEWIRAALEAGRR